MRISDWSSDVCSSDLALLQNDRYMSRDGRLGALTSHNFLMTTYSAGIGDIYPLRIGRYDFGLRFEALYRYGNRAETVNRRYGDIAPTNEFHDVLVNAKRREPCRERGGRYVEIAG